MIARMLLPSLVFASMCAALYAVFIYVPTEKEMGVVQRIFYFHVPAAISAFIAFFLVFVGSIQYLRTRPGGWPPPPHPVLFSETPKSLIFLMIVVASRSRELLTSID